MLPSTSVGQQEKKNRLKSNEFDSRFEKFQQYEKLPNKTARGYWCKNCCIRLMKFSDLKDHQCKLKVASLYNNRCICTSCGLKFQNAPTLEIHQRSYCHVQQSKQKSSEKEEIIPTSELVGRMVCVKKKENTRQESKRKKPVKLAKFHKPSEAETSPSKSWNDSWVCRKCGLKFPKPQILLQHQLTDCNPLQLKQEVLGSENKSTSPSNDLPTTCRRCRLDFPSFFVLIQHQTISCKKNSASKAIKFCEICRFYYKTNLDTHLKYYCKASTSKRTGKIPIETQQTETSTEGDLEEDEIADKPELETDNIQIKVEVEEPEIKNEPTEEVDMKLEAIDGVQKSPGLSVTIKTEPEENYLETSQYVLDINIDVKMEEYEFHSKRKRQRDK